MVALLQNENTVATATGDGSELLAAREICSDIRLALDGILSDAANGARDLRDGLDWSRNLDRFETVSMRQLQCLARFPISTADQRFGALVHRARAAFVAFRETVRREIIGAIDPHTDSAAYDKALERVAGRSALARDSLKSVEQAITQYWQPFTAAARDHDPQPQLCGQTTGRAELREVPGQ